jgi:hypothetical protein
VAQALGKLSLEARRSPSQCEPGIAVLLFFLSPDRICQTKAVGNFDPLDSTETRIGSGRVNRSVLLGSFKTKQMIRTPRRNDTDPDLPTKNTIQSENFNC